MYHAGELLGFWNEQRKLHPAAIPKEDIENPEQYQAVYDRLAELSDFSGSFKPTADFSLFEVDYYLQIRRSSISVLQSNGNPT